MEHNKKPLMAAAVLLFAVVLMAVVWASNRPAGSSGMKSLGITVVHGDGTEKNFDIQTDSETLDNALTENGIVENNQEDFGLFIKTADGETADESKEEWWCITKGGEQVNTGASETVIADGEAYELTLKKGFDNQ